MGKIIDSMLKTACEGVIQVTKVWTNNKSFERGKEGKRPLVMGNDSELQEIADKAYEAGQMSSLAESAKKFSEK
jgi:hypothetical protein